MKSAGAAKEQLYLDWGPLHRGMSEGRFLLVGSSKTRRRERNSGNSFSSEPAIFVGCAHVGIGMQTLEDARAMKIPARLVAITTYCDWIILAESVVAQSRAY